MRAGLDGLSALVQTRLSADVFSGAYSGDHDRLFRPNVTEHSARPAL